MFTEARKLADSGGLTTADLERVKKARREADWIDRREQGAAGARILPAGSVALRSFPGSAPCLQLHVHAHASQPPPTPPTHGQGNRIDLLSLLRSNSSMASLLASYSATYGGEPLAAIGRELAALEGMDAAAVRRVASATFRPDNVFTGLLAKGAESG